MTILPLAYLPSIEYFAHLRRGGCVVDLGEHFVKRSERNRARVLGPEGAMALTVHLAHANRPHQPMREVRLDYSKRWQHQHWGALAACYRSSSFFDFYAEQLAPFYRSEPEFLVDLNMGLLDRLCALTRIAMPAFSERYVEAGPDDLDLRPKHAKGPAFVAEPYVQVFSDRLAFVPGLSVADLLFCEGPATDAVLANCRP